MVSLEPERVADVLQMAREYGVPALQLGRTGGGELQLGSLIDLPVEELAGAWYRGLDTALR